MIEVSAIFIATIVINILGVFGNLLFLLAMFHQPVDSKITVILFRHQSLIDGLSCLVGLLVQVLPKNWTLGLAGLDAIICHINHSFFLFLYLVGVSIYGLIVIAIDRYFAVCQASDYKILQTRFPKVALLLTCYLFALISTLHVPFQVQFINETVCTSPGAIFSHSPWQSKVFFKVNAVLFFSVFYIIPIGAFIVLYSKIIIRIIAANSTVDSSNTSPEDGSANSGGNNNSNAYRTSVRQFTLVTLVTIAVFAITLSFDCFFYLLSKLDVLPQFKVYGTELNIAAMLMSVNSMANPYIFAVFMGSMRNRMIATFTYPFRRLSALFTNRPLTGSRQLTGTSNRIMPSSVATVSS